MGIVFLPSALAFIGLRAPNAFLLIYASEKFRIRAAEIVESVASEG